MKNLNLKKSQIIENAIFDVFYKSKIDKRRRSIKQFFSLGFSEDDLIFMRIKKKTRLKSASFLIKSSFEERKTFFNLIKNATLDLSATSSRYNTTGIDWCAFHRPSSNGKGWVIIAPDDPSNNVYTEDTILVEFLKRKFLK